MSERSPRIGSIAVIGMACRVPGADTADAFWSNLVHGIESIRRLTTEELIASGVEAKEAAHPAYVAAKGVLDGADRFDAALFGYAPREASLMDPQHRVMLECAWEALEHGGHGAPAPGERVAVYAGVALNTYLLKNVFPHRDTLASEGDLSLMVCNDKDFVPTRISYQLDLAGPSVNVQTACSTSLVAIHMACQSLLTHQCDMALAGGAAITAPLQSGYLYREGGILSADGHCRAFDAHAGGTVPGNGAGMVLLKRLEDAIADGDTVHAVIAGSAVNNDGADKIGYTAPSIAGQTAVIAQAHLLAGVSPDTIGYVEAHGTGTPLGDPIEVAALTAAFRGTASASGYCALGSVKSNIGHLDTAAGVIGFIKAALAVRNGVIPPSMHFERANPALDLDRSPFYVPTTTRAWPVAGLRRAGVSSFGIGGTNAHVVIEEAPALAAVAPSARKAQVLCISARTPDALAHSAARLAERLADAGEPLADVAFTLARGRRVFACRRAVVAAEASDAAAQLRRPAPSVPFVAGRPVAWLFPGQGAQHIGMGATLAKQEPAFRDALDDAACALVQWGAPDVRGLMWPDEATPEASLRLTETSNAQAAVFAMEYALAQLWRSWGVQPAAVLGHSVGEFAAAVVAGVMSLDDAARIVAARGRLMQALPPGAMLAVHCSEEAATHWLRPGVSLSAINAPQACVLGGSLDDIEALERDLRREDIEVQRLRTSHAFHTRMMDPMLATFRDELSRVTLRAPAMPWVSSMTGTWMSADEAVDPEYWVRQVREPVRYATAVGALLQSADHACIEVGPGETLTALSRQQATRERVLASSCGRVGGDEAKALALAAATLWSSGTPLDWAGYYASEKRRRVPLPAYPFERERYWIDPPTERERAISRATSGTQMYVPTWRVAPGPDTSSATGRWLLLGDEHGVGDALAQLLTQSGATVQTVSAGECARADVRTYARWLDDARPDHVVHLATLTARGQVADTQADDCNYLDVLALSQALARHARAAGGQLALTVVTNGVHEVTGQDVVRAGKALLLGPVRVLPQEHPGIACRLVDIEDERPSDVRVQQLLAECLSTCDDIVVAHRGRRRWVQGYEPLVQTVAAAPALRQGGVYLITGGFGALGLRIARHLHETAGARLVLTGRRPVPPPSEWPALVAADDDVVTFDIDDAVVADAPPVPIPVYAREIDAAYAETSAEIRTRLIAEDTALARTLDRYCAALVCECFERAGVPMKPGLRYTMPSLTAKLGVVAQYTRFLEFMVGVVADAGIVGREGEAITVLPHARDAVAGLHERAVTEHAPLAPVFQLLRHCGARYHDILRGAVSGVSVLYPEGGSRLVEESVAAVAGRTRHAHYARTAGRLLKRSLEGRTQSLRVLEVGGGNRFLTREILPMLGTTGVEYWFTDVSREFVDRAQAWAAEAGYDHVRFGVLDISRDARAQGWNATFDAVVALDVVHATRDVEATLRHLRELVAPGGTLHLIETLPPARWNTMVWGIAADWWRYSDRYRSASPLPSVAQWNDALSAAGFDNVGAHPGDARGDCALLYGMRAAQPVGNADVLAIQADVTDAAQMAAVVVRARERYGAIHGVIHAAGVEASGALALQRPDGAAPRRSAKVHGTRVLEQVLQDEPLDFLLLCSSVTSLVGGVGNVEYAAANAFLDAFAHERAARGYPVVSVNWDRWRGLGMAATVEERHRARTGESLAGGLPVEDALACLTAIAAAPRAAQIVVAPSGFEDARRGAEQADVTTLAIRMVPVAHHPRPFMATPFAAPRTDLEQRIAAVWQETLGVDTVGVDDDFSELGGDSLIAIKVAARLREELGLALGVSALFEAPTVARLAAHIEAVRWAAAPAPAAHEDLDEGVL